MFERDIVTTLQKRLSEPRKFIQIVVGPRQTGKSTAVYQALEKIKSPIVQFSFDRPRDQNAKRLEKVWDEARLLLVDSDEVVLSLDEVQKVPDWSSTVKYLWDNDTFNKRNIKVILTGSSAFTIKAVWRNHSKEDMRKSNQPNGRFLNAVKRLGIH